eukprot:616172-Hanusia_phi.AAC.1
MKTSLEGKLQQLMEQLADHTKELDDDDGDDGDDDDGDGDDDDRNAAAAAAGGGGGGGRLKDVDKELRAEKEKNAACLMQ